MDCQDKVLGHVQDAGRRCGEFSFQVHDPRRVCGALQQSVSVPFFPRDPSPAGFQGLGRVRLSALCSFLRALDLSLEAAIQHNESIQPVNIPLDANDYVVNGSSAIE